MDIPAFISDLLAQQGVLVIPGLGTFTRVRVDGYYNKDQQQFFPPTQQIQFKSEHSDDNILADLIAKERQISVASAKYFIEKFVAAILEQAGVGNAQFGNIGAFSTRRGNLVFAANELNETDEAFYGLAPVKLKRNSSFKQNVVAPPRLVELPEADPEPVPVPFTEPPVEVPQPEEVETTVEEEEEHVDEEETGGHKINIWLVLALIIVLIGVGLIALFEYKPALFNGVKPLFTKLAHTTSPPPAKISTADSLKRAQQARKDMGITHTVPSVQNDSVGVDTFRIVVSSWQGLKGATQDARNQTKQGIKAEIHKVGSRYLVTVATYNNNDSAKTALPVFKEKLKNPEIRIQIYPFKKP
jgi:hypothetical protein